MSTVHVFRSISMDVWKVLKKITKTRNFWFTVIAYPVLSFLYAYTSGRIDLWRKTVELSGEIVEEIKGITIYSGLSVGILLFVGLFSAYEKIETSFMYKSQGDKLRIRQGQKDWKGSEK